MPDDTAYLLDILNEARAIGKFTRGMSYAEFLKDERTRKAVERSFEIIGEASNQLSAEFRRAHPEFPWRWMTDTRNVIIHEYRRINYAVLWETILYDFPELIRNLEPLVPPEESLE
jgi:uncharacterized protein with HEPN domain